MSVVKINAITPAEGLEAELEARFGNRAREVEHMEGFEGFQLLRPVEGEGSLLRVHSLAFRRGLPTLGEQ